MLVLSRKKNDSIVIGDSVEIVVVEVRGDKVRLGVNAPSDVPIHRREVFDAMQQSKAPAEDEIVALSKLWDEFAERTRELDNELHSLAAEPGSFERRLRDVTGSERTTAEFDYIAQSAAKVVASTPHSACIEPAEQDREEARDESRRQHLQGSSQLTQRRPWWKLW
jgi:carbon storage regulator